MCSNRNIDCEIFLTLQMKNKRSLLSLYSGASLQGTSWGWVLCPFIQLSLSTRDKLGVGVLCPLERDCPLGDSEGD